MDSGLGLKTSSVACADYCRGTGRFSSQGGKLRRFKRRFSPALFTMHIAGHRQ